MKSQADDTNTFENPINKDMPGMSVTLLAHE